MMKRSGNVGEKILIWSFFVIFLLYAISLAYPFLWCLINSFKEKTEFFNNIWGLPWKWTFENWLKSFEMTSHGLSMGNLYLNSIIFTVVNTFLHLMSSSAAAYIMAKYHFRGRSAVYTFLVIVMMIPSMGSMASVYKLYNDVGLINTYIGIFLQNCGGFGTYFLMLYGFYKNLSWSYAEAASVDGASHFVIYLRIMLPMAVPALTAVGLLVAIGQWNDYFTVYMYAPEKATIAVGLQDISVQMQAVMNYPRLFAAMMFSILPILAVFACFQKTIMNNTAIGGIKG